MDKYNTLTEYPSEVFFLKEEIFFIFLMKEGCKWGPTGGKWSPPPIGIRNTQSAVGTLPVLKIMRGEG